MRRAVGGRDVAAMTGAAGALSLAVSLGTLWPGLGQGGRGAWSVWSVVETGALLVLIVLAVRVAARDRAAVAAAVGGAAVTGVWMLRFDPPGVSPTMLAGLGFWTAVAASAVAAGLYLRSLDGHHTQALAAVAARRSQPPPPASPVVGPDEPGPLTTRELEIVALVAQGHTNGEIAAELFISAGTVKNHVANVQRKLGTRNRVGIAAWAWHHRSPTS